MTSTESTNQDIAKKLLALRVNFYNQIPGRLKDIMQIWQRITQQEWDWDACKEMHRKVHTLTGSAPTFGFNTLGKRAREAEILIKAWVSETRIPDTAEQQTLSDMFQSLHDYDEKEITSGPFTTNLADLGLPKAHADSPIYLLKKNRQDAIKLRTQLEQFNYYITEFNSEHDLTVSLQESLPAVIILDIDFTTEKNSGAIFCKKLKDKYGDNLPIILISGENDFEARLEAIHADCNAFLAEPVDLSQLIDMLDEFVHPLQHEPYRILIVDDDTELAEHYKLTLEQSEMEVSTLSDPRDILTTLAEVRPELIIMDVYMPICSGQELAALIRQHENYLSIPIVFLSTEANMDKQFKAMRMGGDDFLTKPINDRHLTTTVAIRAERSRVLNAQMIQDSLTGLLKHTKIKEHLSIEVNRAQRSGEALSFAMLDIDHFKSVNDNYGHLTGDRVIKSLARLLQQRLRKSDSVGRYGGEEFAVVLPSCDGERAITVLNDIRKSFADLVFNYEGQQFSVTVSIGIADLSDFSSAEAMNLGADEALYQAKQEGRNRIVVAAQRIGPNTEKQSEATTN